VEVPVERTVQYDAPREGAFQITSGKYQVASEGGLLQHYQHHHPHERVSRESDQLSPAPPQYHAQAFSPSPQYNTQAAGAGWEQVAYAARAHSPEYGGGGGTAHGRGEPRSAGPNISTLGSTNALRDSRERATAPRERAPAGGQSPRRASGKKIGLGLKLKRNSAVRPPRPASNPPSPSSNLHFPAAVWLGCNILPAYLPPAHLPAQ
jgi:hypothetical protein